MKRTTLTVVLFLLQYPLSVVRNLKMLTYVISIQVVIEITYL